MGYAHATLSDAVTALAARLSDSGLQWWGAGATAELVAYLQESLRTWNALTSFWRAEFNFDLLTDTWWYDLTAQAGTLRPFTLYDTDLIEQIEYHLLEPLTSSYPLAWAGSNQFAIADILGALQRRRDETLAVTGCHLTQSLVVAAPGRITLPDSVIDIRRVAWLPTTGLGYPNSPLSPSDLQTKKYFDPGWTTLGGAPQTYLRNAEPPLSFDVDRTVAVAGNYELITVDASGALLSTVASLLGIPDDWSWVVKFGALSDLLNRESLAKDALRAEYCAKRYAQGLMLLEGASALLGLRVNNIPLDVDSVKNGDFFNPEWQAAVAGAPQSAYVAGLNLVAFNPKPNSSIAYSVTAYVVENAPVPVNPTDKIQLSREDYDAVLDYAQHLAAFKLGGAEFLATMPLFQRFLKRAAIYNSKLVGMSELYKSMYETSQLEEQRNPRYATSSPLEVPNA